MRRTICIAIALVSLALIGLMCGRVTKSSAYIVRARFSEIREGMTRKEVHALMPSDPDVIEPRGDRVRDLWFIAGSYVVNVQYKADPNDKDFLVGKDKEVVLSKDFTQAESSLLDKLLEACGFPSPRISPQTP